MTNENPFPIELVDPKPFRVCGELQVITEEDAKMASDLRKALKDRLKKIEEQRTFLKAPSLEQCRRIDELAKKAAEPFQAFLKDLDSKMNTWDLAQNAARIEAEKKRRAEELARLEAEKKKALEAVVSGEQEAAEKAAQNVAEIEKNAERLAAAPIEPKSGVKGGNSMMYFQERWTFEVVNAAEVPREFLIVDEGKLQKYAVAMKETASVAGVRFFTKRVPGGR